MHVESILYDQWFPIEFNLFELNSIPKKINKKIKKMGHMKRMNEWHNNHQIKKKEIKELEKLHSMKMRKKKGWEKGKKKKNLLF